MLHSTRLELAIMDRFFLSVVLLAVGYAAFAPRLTCSLFTYATGPFQVVFDPDNTPVIQVMQNQRTVWFTSRTNFSFVSTANVQENISQNGGVYAITNKVLQECASVEILANGTHSTTAENVVYFTGSLCDEAQFRLTFQAVDVVDKTTKFTHLVFNLSVSSKYNQVRLMYGCEQDEQFYGFGSQYSQLNMKGSRLPLFLSEQGVGRGLQPITSVLDYYSPGAGGTRYTTYTRVPFYITNHFRSLLLESLEYTVFDMTYDNHVIIQLNAQIMEGRIITGSSPLDLITSYTAFSGRLRPLPAWVGKGAILGLQGGTESVQHTIEKVQQVWGNLSDVTAVWLQDWTGQRVFNGTQDLPRVGLWWNWEVDSTHYPNWTLLVSHLKSKGIKTLTYINCMLSDVSHRGTPYAHNYFQEALQEGYLVHNADGTVWTGYGNSSMVDLTNPKAYQWMVDIIVNNMILTGACGWMCDFGEAIPLTAAQKSGINGQKLHSLYPTLWGQANADAIQQVADILVNGSEQCSSDDITYFMRSGNVHTPKSTRLFWLGDQLVTWDAFDGLATVIIGMLSQGISGYSLTHSDIGGYTAVHKSILKYVRSKELFMRWCELAAFSVMYRSHLGTLPAENWQFDSDIETTSHFFNMSIVFQSWDFYRNDLMNEASAKGWPIARPMFLVYPDNTAMYSNSLWFQFMIGTELLIAPVYQKGKTSVQVILPKGVMWVHLWTGKSIQGEDTAVEIPAPMGQPCIFYPSGSKVAEQMIMNLKQRNLL